MTGMEIFIIVASGASILGLIIAIIQFVKSKHADKTVKIKPKTKTKGDNSSVNNVNNNTSIEHSDNAIQNTSTQGNNSSISQTSIKNLSIQINDSPKTFKVHDLSKLGFVITPSSDANLLVSKAFQPRDTEIRTLKNYISQNNKTVLVSGMGGIGKTEICKKLYNEYIELHRNKQPIDIEHIGFMKYENTMDFTLISSLDFQTDSYEQSVQFAWRELKKIAFNKRVLLFIDNVNKTPAEDDSLKKLYSLTCSIIITSRHKEFGEFTTYEIKKMSYPFCKELFKSNYGDIKEEEEPFLQDIIENLADRHTLTVKLFGRIAKDNGWSIEKLKANLNSRHFNLSFIEDGEEHKLIEQYQELFALSNLSKEEINILEAFSIFPYRMLPIALCVKWMQGDVQNENINLLISKINDKGWLESEDSSFGMHPVISEVIRSIRQPSIDNHINLIKSCTEGLKEDYSTILSNENNIWVFAESIIQYFLHEESLEIADLLIACGEIYVHKANYSIALEWFNKAFIIRQNLLGIMHEDTSYAIHNIGVVYHHQSKYTDALKWYEKALKIREKVLGHNHPDTATTMNNMANVYRNQGKYNEAFKLCEEAMIIRENTPSLDPKYIAISYNDMAYIFRGQNKYEEALKLFNKALDLRVEIYGIDHPETALSYSNVASIYVIQGKYEEAIKGYKKALNIFEAYFDKSHPTIGSIYNDIGGAYLGLKEYSQAIKWHTKALMIAEKRLDIDHINTAVIYNNLGLIHQYINQKNKALEFHVRAYIIYLNILGKKNISTIHTEDSIKRLYISFGLKKEAFNYWLKREIQKDKYKKRYLKDDEENNQED